MLTLKFFSGLLCPEGYGIGLSHNHTHGSSYSDRFYRVAEPGILGKTYGKNHETQMW